MTSPARWLANKRRATKWRQHCSTCGVTFPGPQIWGYCSKLCEVSRDGTEDPGDLPADVIEEMIQLGLAKELAPRRDKQAYQDCIDNMERSHARKTFRPKKTIEREDPRFWEYIMDKQFDKYDRTRARLNEEFLRTLRRLVESEKTTGKDMAEVFPDCCRRIGLSTESIRLIASSGAIEKNAGKLPSSPEFWEILAQYDDDEIDMLVAHGSIDHTSTVEDLV